MSLPTHYLLPKANIGFTIIPKTGCTTLMNYLFSLEQTLLLDPQATKGPDYIGSSIHFSKMQTKYKVKSLDSPKHNGLTKVLALRNPYHRALSAWSSKLLYAHLHYSIVSRLKDEALTPGDFNSLADLNGAFEAFLARLSLDRAFLESDRHWRPQNTFVNNLSNYNVVLETSSLGKLQSALANNDYVAGLVGNRPVPKLNATRPELVRFIGTDKAWHLVDQIYAEDFELLRTAGYESMPPVVAKLDDSATMELIKAQKPAVLLSRELSENNFIRRELELLKGSRSWRWTAWLRAAGKPFSRWF